jgi:hypothetical protein
MMGMQILEEGDDTHTKERSTCARLIVYDDAPIGLKHECGFRFKSVRYKDYNDMQWQTERERAGRTDSGARPLSAE